MANETLTTRLNAIADRLGPVAGELMRRACMDEREHVESCECQTCRAFLATHQCQHELEAIIRELTVWPRSVTPPRGGGG